MTMSAYEKYAAEPSASEDLNSWCYKNDNVSRICIYCFCMLRHSIYSTMIAQKEKYDPETQTA